MIDKQVHISAVVFKLEPGDIGRALDEMKRAGAIFLKSSDLYPEAVTPAAAISDLGYETLCASKRVWRG